jgi:hypothetical protein
MTEGQRDYLADLALQKGVVLDDTEDKSVAWASAKIEELKAMPDATFPEPSAADTARLDKKIDEILAELAKWGFE